MAAAMVRRRAFTQGAAMGSCTCAFGPAGSQLRQRRGLRPCCQVITQRPSQPAASNRRRMANSANWGRPSTSTRGLLPKRCTPGVAGAAGKERWQRGRVCTRP